MPPPQACSCKDYLTPRQTHFFWVLDGPCHERGRAASLPDHPHGLWRPLQHARVELRKDLDRRCGSTGKVAQNRAAVSLLTLSASHEVERERAAGRAENKYVFVGTPHCRVAEHRQQPSQA